VSEQAQELISEIVSKAKSLPIDWIDQIIALLYFTAELTSVAEIETKWGSWGVFADEATLWIVQDDDIRAVWAVDLESIGDETLQEWIDCPSDHMDAWTRLIETMETVVTRGERTCDGYHVILKHEGGHRGGWGVRWYLLTLAPGEAFGPQSLYFTKWMTREEIEEAFGIKFLPPDLARELGFSDLRRRRFPSKEEALRFAEHHGLRVISYAKLCRMVREFREGAVHG